MLGVLIFCSRLHLSVPATEISFLLHVLHLMYDHISGFNTRCIDSTSSAQVVL